MKKKTAILLILALLLFLGVAGINVFSTSHIAAETVHHQVVVTDGVTTSGDATYQFEVEHAGTYRFYTEWNTNPSGLITGFRITAPNGEIIYHCSAGGLTLDAALEDLEPGIYTVCFRPITNDEQLRQFFAEAGTVLDSTEDETSFAYAENETWDMEYLFQFKKGISYLARFSVTIGLTLGIVLALLILITTKKDNSLRCQYDERQEVVRGKAYKYTYFTMMGCVIFFLFWYTADFPAFADPEVLLLLVFLLGTFVHITYSIWHEAYFALNENKKLLLIVFAVAGILCIGLGVFGLLHGNIVVDGKITFLGVDLLAGLLCIHLFVMLFSKKQRDRKDEDA